MKHEKYHFATKKTVEVEMVEYTFNIMLKNVSDEPVTVATGSLSQQWAITKEKVMKLELSELKTYNGELIIPAREDLRLVELRPGEVALVGIVLREEEPLEAIKFIYAPQDLYGGRFGYWTGKATSDQWTPEKKE